ncbi:MAG: hypothetical protein KAS32_15810 [Candidatus Peribacteraceae bacterium]|nr:hypothetical protein [Candidatus Peribacteraceae bacterium]
MKTYLGCMFFNEFDILEVHLNTMGPHVDKFIISESTTTFTGEPKPLYFDQVKDEPRFKKFEDKLVRVVYKGIPKNKLPVRGGRGLSNAWVNENAQRNALAKALPKLADDDLLIVPDLDEIINPKILPAILKMSKVRPGRVLHHYYMYYFNYMKGARWPGAAFCRGKDYGKGKEIEVPHDLRKKRKKWGSNRTIQHGGWHFSYFGGNPETIIYKMKSWAHNECDKPTLTNKNILDKCLKKGLTCYTVGATPVHSKLTILPTDHDDLPEFVLNNRDKFKHHFREVERD